MPLLKTVARTLGPLGLMPNLKVKTLVKMDELKDAIKESQAGQFQYK
jgi:ribosomal protein L1